MDRDESNSSPYAYGVHHQHNRILRTATQSYAPRYSPISYGDAQCESPQTHQRIDPSAHYSSTVFNETPHSSPGRTLKFSGKKLQSLWSTIKKLSPVRRIKNKNRKQKLLINGKRLYSSHPDISCSNLAELTQCKSKKSRDDMDATFSKNAQPKESPFIAFYDECVTLNKVHVISHNEQPNWIYEGTSFSDAENLESALSRQRFASLRQHPFYHLEIHLQCAKNLLAKDSCGTSDPYVKFKIKNRVVYKSRVVNKCLDPKWDEYFVIPIEDAFQSVELRAYDYDFGFQDDYLGAALIDLTKLDLSIPRDLALPLTESGTDSDIQDQSWGEVYLTVTLIPKTQEDKEQFYRKGFKSVVMGAGIDGSTSVKKLRTQLWDSVVNIVLVEGKNLISKDENGFSDPYVKFRLGNEKYKSKIIAKNLNPFWGEQFDVHTYPDQSRILEMTVYDKDLHGKDDFMGKCTINLNELSKEETHKIWKDLEGGSGSLLILLTISGTYGSEEISNINAADPKRESLISKKYGIFNSFSNFEDIGFLTVKVFKAEGLAAADLCGTSDPFCVIELVNARCQTNTEYKTLSPEWNKVFTFQVKDLHSVLEITVFDEDRDKKFEFLGKVAIPLLKIKDGEKKWYGLKDKKLVAKAKGQILLEMQIIFNYAKAGIRTFNPRETKFIRPEQKFKRTVFVRNVTRLRSLLMEIYDIAKYINSCFQWESVPRSIISFLIFLIVTYFFELYMFPIAVLLLYIKNYLTILITNYFMSVIKEEENDEFEDGLSDDDDDEIRNEEKKSLKEKLQTVQEVTTMIQNVLGEIASCGERVKNSFNFSVPFLSWLAITCLIIVSIILYFIPLRYLILLWGINKFTKKLRNPNAINNNELLDYLSRVPDNDEKIMYGEYKVIMNSQTNVERDRKMKKKTA